MRYAAIVIALALLSQTAAAQTEVISKTRVISKDASKIRQFVASQPMGQQLTVCPDARTFYLGVLSKVEADTFEITDGQRTEKFSYAAVVSVARTGDSGPVEKKGLWKRIGQGTQNWLAFAALGTLLLVTYPVDLAVGQSTNAKAKSLKKEAAKALSPSSTASQVMAFLDARKIEHSQAAFNKYAGQFIPGLPQHAYEIHGIIHRSWGYYISLVFYFDEAQRLTHYEIDVSQDTI